MPNSPFASRQITPELYWTESSFAQNLSITSNTITNTYGGILLGLVQAADMSPGTAVALISPLFSLGPRLLNVLAHSDLLQTRALQLWLSLLMCRTGHYKVPVPDNLFEDHHDLSLWSSVYID